MIIQFKETTPCEVFCGVKPHTGRTGRLNPLTAFAHLHRIGFLDERGRLRDRAVFLDEAIDAANYIYDGCIAIRNRYLEAAKEHDEDAMYELYVEQMAVAEEPVSFTVRAIRGIEDGKIRLAFFEAVADEIEYLRNIEDFSEDVDPDDEDDTIEGIRFATADDMNIGLTD